LRADSIAAATVAAVIAALIWPPCLLLVWNTTPSIPIGLYVITPAPPRRGDLSVMRLPRRMETLAVARAILTSHIPVLKPVAAAAGDRVCRMGTSWQSLVTSIAKNEPCRRGKDAAGFRAPKSSFWLGTPIASIAVTTARYN
jgi:type IV secretory pathway protease TraF